MAAVVQLDPENAPALKTVREGQYLFACKFDTNSTSAPDGADPSHSDVAVARTGVGIFTVTLGDDPPTEYQGAAAAVLGDEPGLDARVVSYASGVLTVHVYERTDPVAPTGSITCVAKASLIDTETLVIGDGINAPVTFEFDVAGDGVTAGNIQVDVSGDTTAADVAATLAPLITANVPALTVTDNMDGTITLTSKLQGTVGNVTITETVADAGFLVSGMSGGVALAVEAAADTNNKTVFVAALFSQIP